MLRKEVADYPSTLFEPTSDAIEPSRNVMNLPIDNHVCLNPVRRDSIK